MVNKILFSFIFILGSSITAKAEFSAEKLEEACDKFNTVADNWDYISKLIEHFPASLDASQLTEEDLSEIQAMMEAIAKERVSTEMAANVLFEIGEPDDKAVAKKILDGFKTIDKAASIKDLEKQKTALVAGTRAQVDNLDELTQLCDKKASEKRKEEEE